MAQAEGLALDLRGREGMAVDGSRLDLGMKEIGVMKSPVGM